MTRANGVEEQMVAELEQLLEQATPGPATSRAGAGEAGL